LQHNIWTGLLCDITYRSMSVFLCKLQNTSYNSLQ